MQHEKPFVGITTEFQQGRKEQPSFAYVAAGYIDALSRVGAIPVLIPPLGDPDDIERILDRLDAVVMIGGADLDPRRDGFMVHPSMRLMHPRREEFDRTLIGLIARRRMPVLGIGAGMQLLNVSQGGSLYLHIPEDAPRAVPHHDPLDANHRHALVVTPGSHMENVYGEGEIRVNSMHHMAVDEVAPGFVATARCPDGIIEAIESEMDDWFAMGTQFHPESASATALDLGVFEEFLIGATGREVAGVRLVA